MGQGVFRGVRGGMRGAVSRVICGRERWLCYTADAYFEIQELCGGRITDAIGGADRSSYDTAVRCLVVLAREGELCRRYMGYEAEDMLTEDEARRYLLPNDMVDVKKAVFEAISAGLGTEAAPEKEGPVDVGLAEYEKKTGVRQPTAQRQETRRER